MVRWVAVENGVKRSSLQGTNRSPYQGTLEDDFPLPQVGYLSFLGGVNKTKSFNGISRGSTHLSPDTTPGQCAWNFLDRKSIDRSRRDKNCHWKGHRAEKNRWFSSGESSRKGNTWVAFRGCTSCWIERHRTTIFIYQHHYIDGILDPVNDHLQSFTWRHVYHFWGLVTPERTSTAPVEWAGFCKTSFIILLSNTIDIETLCKACYWSPCQVYQMGASAARNQTH